MTIRRDVSLGIQNYVGSVILRDPTVKKDKYHRQGKSQLTDYEFMAYTLRWVAKQQRPYSDVYLVVRGLTVDEYWWSAGYSKCIGKVGDRLPDEWDPYEGLRLALARAATDIGKQIQEYENADSIISYWTCYYCNHPNMPSWVKYCEICGRMAKHIKDDVEIKNAEKGTVDESKVLPPKQQQKTAIDVPVEELAEDSQPTEVEITGFEKFTTYIWHGIHLARVSDFPGHVDAINKFMRGQTRPSVDGANPNDYIYLHDFENFLAKGTLFWD